MTDIQQDIERDIDALRKASKVYGTPSWYPRILDHINAQQKRIEELEHDGTLWAEANWKRVKELERERDELKMQLQQWRMRSRP